MAGGFWLGKKCPWVTDNPQVFKKGHITWNRGKKYSLKHSGQFKKGQHISPETEFKKGILPPTHWKKGNIPWNKGKKLPQYSGKNAPNWKGGITDKIYKQRRKALFRGGGKLSIKTIQLVYEDNIKKYGTLTCYLCLKSIKFGQDTLEHKIPLSRKGTNEYENLAIACYKCNNKKFTKTEEEYRGVLKCQVSGRAL